MITSTERIGNKVVLKVYQDIIDLKTREAFKEIGRAHV
jgi:hypothetical protein